MFILLNLPFWIYHSFLYSVVEVIFRAHYRVYVRITNRCNEYNEYTHFLFPDKLFFYSYKDIKRKWKRRSVDEINCIFYFSFKSPRNNQLLSFIKIILKWTDRYKRFRVLTLDALKVHEPLLILEHYYILNYSSYVHLSIITF